MALGVLLDHWGMSCELHMNSLEYPWIIIYTYSNILYESGWNSWKQQISLGLFILINSCGQMFT